MPRPPQLRFRQFPISYPLACVVYSKSILEAWLPTNRLLECSSISAAILYGEYDGADGHDGDDEELAAGCRPQTIDIARCILLSVVLLAPQP